MEQKFEFNALPVRTVTDENEETWFAGLDICNILGYANSSDIINDKIDSSERFLGYVVDQSGQRRKAWFISKFGVYALIISSTKPSAKKFKKWLWEDVFPEIRKALKASDNKVAKTKSQ